MRGCRFLSNPVSPTHVFGIAISLTFRYAGSDFSRYQYHLKLMKPLFVHVHIYYTEMWWELKQCLGSIEPHAYDLFISLVEEHPELQNDILEFNPKASIRIVENRGYDVAPFVAFINEAELDDYSYVVKLHSKRDLNKDFFLFANGCMRDVRGSKWRDYLLAFVKSREVFQEHLNYLEMHPQAGMLAAHEIILSRKQYIKPFLARLTELVAPLERADSPFCFVGGTMFIARACLFKQLQLLRIENSQFEEVTAAHDGQLAHVMERYLGYMVYSQAATIESIRKESLLSKMQHMIIHICFYTKRFIYQDKISKSGKRRIKICRIPLPSRKN